jgi:hypothetical protein
MGLGNGKPITILMINTKKMDGATYTIVKSAARNVSKVTEAIPLSTTLSVQSVKIIVSNTGMENLDFMLELLASK